MLIIVIVSNTPDSATLDGCLFFSLNRIHHSEPSRFCNSKDEAEFRHLHVHTLVSCQHVLSQICAGIRKGLFDWFVAAPMENSIRHLCVQSPNACVD
jgi:hypothetical protein